MARAMSNVENGCILNCDLKMADAGVAPDP
jgi:hypothetical protein